MKHQQQQIYIGCEQKTHADNETQCSTEKKIEEKKMKIIEKQTWNFAYGLVNQCKWNEQQQQKKDEKTKIESTLWATYVYTIFLR